MAKSYSATLITKNLAGKLSTACGSFGNISIDGRLSQETAVNVARETFKKECEFKNQSYLGFIIEKTERFVNYSSPRVIDNTCNINQVEGV